MMKCKLLNMLSIKWLSAVGILLFCSYVSAELSQSQRVSNQDVFPRGIFALTKSDRPIPEALLIHPSITGIVVRQKWSSLERIEGEYDWSYLDDQFSRVSQHDKEISLILSYGGLSIPEWLSTKDIRFFKFRNKNPFSSGYGERMSIPLFWDAKALNYKTQMIGEIGARYTDQPGLTMVSAQCANALTGDWNIPDGKANIKKWKKMGYSAKKLLRACKKIIDATMEAFPKQIIKMAIGPVSEKLGDESTKVAKAIVRYARNKYPGRFIAQRNNLAVTTLSPRESRKQKNAWKVIWGARPAIAAQMLWNASTTSCRLNGSRVPCDSAAMLQKAIDIGLAYQVSHLEIYSIDILSEYGDKIIRDTAKIFNDEH